MNELIPTRATLLQRLKNWQDQSSWQDFFELYWKLIYNVALKGGLSSSEAQEVVQETMISVAQHMPTFKYDPALGSFKAWLLKQTQWRIADQFRKRRALSNHVQLLEESSTGLSKGATVVDPASVDLSAVWNAEWEKNLLEAALAKIKRQIDPQKFQMFDLYVNKEWTANKVAETFGVPVGQVYLAKHRVTELIKEEVKRLSKEVT